MCYFRIEPFLSVICTMFLHRVHQTLPLLCFVLLEVNVIQVLIGYVNTTSTQVFVYGDGHNNGTVFPGKWSHSVILSRVTRVMCHFGNSTYKSENSEIMDGFDWSVAPNQDGARMLRNGSKWLVQVHSSVPFANCRNFMKCMKVAAHLIR